VVARFVKIVPTMNDANRPMDATAMQAEAVVMAAQSWAWSRGTQEGQRMTEQEWELLKALRDYGDKWKGLRAR